jgi:hypothetical protein
MVDAFGEIMLAQGPQGFGQVVHHEPVVKGEQLDPHHGISQPGR